MLVPTMATTETRKPSRLVQAAVRIPQSAVDEYEALAKELNAAAGWEKVTRSDLMRDDLMEALARRRSAKELAGPPVRKKVAR
jgi:hypothetical protein